MFPFCILLASIAFAAGQGASESPPALPVLEGGSAVAPPVVLPSSGEPSARGLSPKEPSPAESSPREGVLSAPPRVLLVTFGPGDEVYAWWGHIALVVEEPREGPQGEMWMRSQMYNYGTFVFDNKMLANFAMGRLEFWLEATVVVPVLEAYAQDDRDIRLLPFQLTPKEARDMAAALRENALPQNRHYLYHHYNDNCATRIRDIWDRVVLNGQFSAWLKEQPARMRIREHTRRYSAVNWPMMLLLDFMQNDELDKRITAYEETFLPDELERRLLEFSASRAEPLTAKPRDFSKAQKRAAPREEPPKTELSCLGAGMGFAFVAGALGHWASQRRRWARRGLGLWGMLWFLLWGFLGTALLAMQFTDHTVTHGNENLFLANPLLLLGVVWAWPFMRKGTQRATERLAWLCLGIAALSWLGLVLKVLPVFDQNNWNMLALVLPVHSALALVFWALARKKAGEPEAAPPASSPKDLKARKPAPTT